MHYTEQHFQIALTLLKGIGPKRAKSLIASCDSLEEIFVENIEILHQKTGLSKNILRQINRKLALEEADKHLEVYNKSEINTHFYTDESFSRRLKQCDDAPLLLYTKGQSLNLNSQRLLAVVGTRHATDYGKGICEELISNLVGKNIIVVSGLAYGIDIEVHRLCLKYQVPTIGVLGHGLDTIYPVVHKKTAFEMCETGGLVSEYLPNTKPDRENFPMRNRIVAGMCDATIVVESKANGGSMITADLANDYQRDVFAFPANVNRQYSAGCNLLIQKQKAHLINNSSDFLEFMNWNENGIAPRQTILFDNFEPDEQTILKFLQGEGAQHVDLIAAHQKMNFGKLNMTLLQLEMMGAIKSLPGNMYGVV